jgi:hypothetical protein
MRISFVSATGLAAAGLLAVASESAGDITTFDNGAEGWVGPAGPGGATFIDGGFGNPAPSLRTQFNDFGITFSNDSNPGFIGDYTQAPQAIIGIDVYTTFLNFFGQDVTRDFIVDLRDYDNPEPGYPWTSVWYNIGVLDAANPGWHTWGVTITDTSATELPPGWGGYGAEDPVTFEPELPADRTFASVLAGVDEIAFTTLVPGFFFGFTDHDVAVDNISLQLVPEPATAGLMLMTVLMLRRRR